MWRPTLAFATLIIASACSSDPGDCESAGGVICSDCANDCLSIELSCEPPKEPACVGLSYFDGQPSDQRCKFCVEE